MSVETDQLDVLSERAAQISIEEAIRRYFSVKDCIVDLEAKSVCILFNPQRHHQVIQAYQIGDDSDPGLEVPVAIALDRLPKPIISLAQPILDRVLEIQETTREFGYWEPLQRQVIEGVIAEVSPNHLRVSFKGGVGCCERQDWISKEPYATGQTHYFWIKRVKYKNEKEIRILLSRRSKKIPEHVLKHFYPRYDFLCVRRIPGEKSWIKTSASRRKWGFFMKKSIRRHLAYEYLQFEN